MTSHRALVIVDAANVIGSRPDGWWRDRPAAVGRLLDSIERFPFPDADVVVVLEGQARAGAAEGMADGIEVVHAPRSGDDCIVELVEQSATRHVTVVTSDRGLRERVHSLGAETVGASRLLRG